MSYNGSDSHYRDGQGGGRGQGGGGKPREPKPPKPPVTPPVTPVPYTAPTPFDWTSNTGRPQMDMASVLRGAMPLAGQVQMPDFKTAAPPVSGNFWDTVASPDMMLMAINSLPKIDPKKKGTAVDPFGFGVDFSSIMNGSPMSGKTGMPGGVTTTPATNTGHGGGAGGPGASRGHTSSSGYSQTGSKSKSGNISMNNPFMMQAFLQSPAYQKLQTVFSPSGVVGNPSGTMPFY